MTAAAQRRATHFMAAWEGNFRTGSAGWAASSATGVLAALVHEDHGDVENDVGDDLPRHEPSRRPEPSCTEAHGERTHQHGVEHATRSELRQEIHHEGALAASLGAVGRRACNP